jgi:hypothetical protein
MAGGDNEEGNGPFGDSPEGRGRRGILDHAEDPAEVVRDWQLLFWAFLLWGVARLAWLQLSPPANMSFNVGIAVGFLLAGILGFAMRYLMRPSSGT